MSGLLTKFASAAVSITALLFWAVTLAAEENPPVWATNSVSLGPVSQYFSNWLVRADKAQEDQPNFRSPLITATPRIEQKLRYDLSWESLPGSRSSSSYGGGGTRGLDLVLAKPVELTIGIPSWQVAASKAGWSDQTFAIKGRLFSAGEHDGNYIIGTSLAVTVPDGSESITSHHFTYGPSLGFGKGWGKIAVLGTIGVSVPHDGGAPSGAGTPLLLNTALEYDLFKYVWPELEFNYSYWPNGKQNGLDQLFVTPGLLLGRIPLVGRLALTVGAGCQVAVTEHPLYHRNIILSVRLAF